MDAVVKNFPKAPAAAPELNVLSELVQKTSQDIRTLLFELRPLGLETQGLLSTLQQYVSRFRDPSGTMRLRLEAPASIPRLPVEIEAAIFIIIQESVNNARKHARAFEVAIYLYIEEGQLVASDLAATRKALQGKRPLPVFAGRGTLAWKVRGPISLSWQAAGVRLPFPTASSPSASLPTRNTAWGRGTTR